MRSAGPGQSATVLVAFASTGGTPTPSIAGKGNKRAPARHRIHDAGQQRGGDQPEISANAPLKLRKHQLCQVYVWRVSTAGCPMHHGTIGMRGMYKFPSVYNVQLRQFRRRRDQAAACTPSRGCSQTCTASPTSTSRPALHHRHAVTQVAHQRHAECEMNRYVRPCVRCRSRKQVDHLRPHTDTSSALTGSSNARNSGFNASARAMLMRCRCPPLNSCG